MLSHLCQVTVVESVQQKTLKLLELLKLDS